MLVLRLNGGMRGLNLHDEAANINPLNADLNYIRHLLTLVRADRIVHISRIRVKASFGGREAEGGLT
jgi:hypothetical protein